MSRTLSSVVDIEDEVLDLVLEILDVEDVILDVQEFVIDLVLEVLDIEDDGIEGRGRRLLCQGPRPRCR